MFYANFKPYNETLCKQGTDSEEQEYNHTESDPVISENLKIILADIAHQELDRYDGYCK